MIEYRRPVRRAVAHHAVAEALQRRIAYINHALSRTLILIAKIIDRQRHVLDIPVEPAGIRLFLLAQSICVLRLILLHIICKGHVSLLLPAFALHLHHELLLASLRTAVRTQVEQIERLPKISRQHPR